MEVQKKAASGQLDVTKLQVDSKNSKLRVLGRVYSQEVFGDPPPLTFWPKMKIRGHQQKIHL